MDKTPEEHLHLAIVNDQPITGNQVFNDTRALVFRDNDSEAVIQMADAIIINGKLNVYLDLKAYKGSRTGAERFFDKCKSIGLNPNKKTSI